MKSKMKKTLEQIIQEDFDKNYRCELKAEDIIARTDYFNKPITVESEVMVCNSDSANLEESLNVGTALQTENQINSTQIIACENELDSKKSKEETKQSEIKEPKNKFLFYQRAFRSAILVTTMLIIVISVLAVNVSKLNDEKKLWNDKIDSQITYNVLSDSELKYMHENADRIYEHCVFEVMLNEHAKLMIYNGTVYLDHQKSNKIYFYKVVDSCENINGLTLQCNERIINVTNDNAFGILTVINSSNSAPYDSFEIIASYGSTSVKYQVCVPTSL